jgi:hypothetical protein
MFASTAVTSEAVLEHAANTTAPNVTIAMIIRCTARRYCSPERRSSQLFMLIHPPMLIHLVHGVT